MSIGLKRGTVRLERHQAGWKDLFEQEKTALESVLGAHSVEIQHVGSTAVQAIDAKPILDVLLGLRSLTEEDVIRPLLESMGYLYRGEQGVSGRILYVKGSDENRTHYLHVTAYDSSFWREQIYFRDILNTQAEIAQAYNQIKQALAAQYWDDRAAYTAGKSVFITSILQTYKP